MTRFDRSSRRAGVACVAAIAALVGLVPGCALFGGDENGTGRTPAAAPRQHPVLANIPLPMGFQLVPERSVARQSGKLRVAQVEFVGKGNVYDVAEFYKQYMPSARFNLKLDRFDNGEYLLRFESDTEECNVRVKRKGDQAVLVIDVGPLAMGGADRPQGPPPTPTRQPGS